MAPPASVLADADPILRRLTALHPKSIDLSLGRMRRLLDRLGAPQNQLPPVVHVAGTNGKGSLVAYLRAIAEAAGYRVHAYTSPHLVRFNERIRVAGQLIDDAALAALLERIEAINGGDPITFFEITTAAAFCAFAEAPADLVLLETGLGGRLDATNVLPAPLLTAITPVGLDHQQYLGNTLTAIAEEKAGIMKTGRPCILGPQTPDALAVLKSRAAELAAPLMVHGEDWTVEPSLDGFVWNGGAAQIELPSPGLPGTHQLQNAGTAIACSRHLTGFRLPDSALRDGLRRVEWPARLQRLTAGPVIGILPPGTELWLDGGHNPMAGEALARVLGDWQSDPATRRPTYLLTGMLNTKAAVGFLAPLRPHVEGAICLRIPGEENSLSAEDLAKAGIQAGLAAFAAASLHDGASLLAGRLKNGPPGRVLIAGSLYLAGRVLANHS